MDNGCLTTYQLLHVLRTITLITTSFNDPSSSAPAHVPSYVQGLYVCVCVSSALPSPCKSPDKLWTLHPLLSWCPIDPY